MCLEVVDIFEKEIRPLGLRIGGAPFDPNGCEVKELHTWGCDGCAEGELIAEFGLDAEGHKACTDRHSQGVLGVGERSRFWCPFRKTRGLLLVPHSSIGDKSAGPDAPGFIEAVGQHRAKMKAPVKKGPLVGQSAAAGKAVLRSEIAQVLDVETAEGGHRCAEAVDKGGLFALRVSEAGDETGRGRDDVHFCEHRVKGSHFLDFGEQAVGYLEAVQVGGDLDGALGGIHSAAWIVEDSARITGKGGKSSTESDGAPSEGVILVVRIVRKSREAVHPKEDHQGAPSGIGEQHAPEVKPTNQWRRPLVPHESRGPSEGRFGLTGRGPKTDSDPCSRRSGLSRSGLGCRFRRAVTGV